LTFKSAVPKFYFVFEGPAVLGNVVQCGSEVDLVFNYGIPQQGAFATVHGSKLKKLQRQNLDFGISIMPRGFRLRDDVWYQQASFREGKLTAPIRFALKADDKVLHEAGFHVVFSQTGCVLYAFFLAVTLTEDSIDKTGVVLSPLDLDLDHMAAAVDSLSAANSR
jgi:hypothetical protein